MNKPTNSSSGDPLKVPDSAEGLWNSAKQVLQTLLSSEIYHLWFSSIRPHTLQANLLTLEVANDFCEVWIKDNYLGLLQEVVTHTAGQPMRVAFRIASSTPVAEVSTSPSLASRPESSVRRITSPSANRRDLDGSPHDFVLNPNNTFETFVVGNNNSFAHAAAQAVAQSPGKSYNPLFLYGGVGLGKTHLLHAIGHYVLGQKRNARVAYVSSEKFTNEYIDGIQNNQLIKFRKRYRQTDVLLIDDIQFLAGKERIQEEFFHTFNALHEAHKQIVLTCDRPASEIQHLEQRLVSRFEWGLSTDMQPPDVETRLAILRKKALSLGSPVSEEILSFLAQRIRTNVRRLEGALIRVASYASLIGKPLALDVVEGLLREVLNEEGKRVITIELIQRKVAEHFDLRISDMTSKRRPENIVFPRQIAMFLARELTENSLNTIGDAFGGRDHGTVMHACRLIKDRMEVDPNVRQVVGYLEKQLQR